MIGGNRCGEVAVTGGSTTKVEEVNYFQYYGGTAS